MSGSPLPDWFGTVFGVIETVLHPIDAYRARRDRKLVEKEIEDALRGDIKPPTTRYTEKA